MKGLVGIKSTALPGNSKGVTWTPIFSLGYVYKETSLILKEDVKLLSDVHSSLVRALRNNPN